MRLRLLTFAVPCILAGNLWGWGCEGHQITALIAHAHLTPAAAAAVDRLLKENPIDPALSRFCKDRPADPMADVSTWADDIRNTEKTALWHYIDIPLTTVGRTSLEPWCPPIGPSLDGKDRPGCVTNAIGYELGILKDQSQSGAERARALRYVIHFAGDIHQPLHDSNNNDRGGNCTAIQFFSEERPTNLHAIWDYKLIARNLTDKKQIQPDYAAALDRRFANKWKAWGKSKPDPVNWAWEGFGLAKTVTYGDLMPAIPLEPVRGAGPDPSAACDLEREKVAALHITVSEAYFRETMPAVDAQLAKGGYRLAALLNEALR